MQARWLVNYGELVGKSHIPRGVPCQDRALCAQENGVTVAVLSDGCGSSDISQYGAEVTVNALCTLFCEQFDQIHSAEILTSRKMIIDGIVSALQQFIAQNGALFEEYKTTHAERYREFCERHGQGSFELDALNATALFVAEKDGKYLIGQIGDGVIGGVVNRKLKIIMEERKDGEVNGTFYPANLYALAQGNPDWYGSSHFQLKKPKNAVVDAFILTSDGVDSFFDLRTPFQKKYTTGVDKLFRYTVEAESGEAARKILQEQFLPALVSGSRANDDCSVAVMVREGYSIDADGYVVTQYEPPKIVEFPKKKEERQEPPKPPAFSEDMAEEEYANAYQEACVAVVQRLGEGAREVIARIEKKALSKRRTVEALKLYATVLERIQTEGAYTVEKTDADEGALLLVYSSDFAISFEWTGSAGKTLRLTRG